MTSLLITMGDACGIGPETIAKLFRTEAARGCVVLGDLGVMRRAARLTGGLLPVAGIERVADAQQLPPMCLPVLQAQNLPADLLDAPLGRVDARAGAAAARAKLRITLRPCCLCLIRDRTSKHVRAQHPFPWSESVPRWVAL